MLHGAVRITDPKVIDGRGDEAWLQELGGSGAKRGGVAMAIVKANPAVGRCKSKLG